MGIQLERALSCFLLLRFLLPLAQGLEIPDPEHISYVRQQREAVLNGTVILQCGSSVPTLFIWVFSKTGSDAGDAGDALAYNYGLGPKTLPLALTLGDVTLAPDTSALLIERVRSEAEGVYTCQSVYDTDQGPKVTFYYTQLTLKGPNAVKPAASLSPVNP